LKSNLLEIIENNKKKDKITYDLDASSPRKSPKKSLDNEIKISEIIEENRLHVKKLEDKIEY